MVDESHEGGPMMIAASCSAYCAHIFQCGCRFEFDVLALPSGAAASREAVDIGRYMYLPRERLTKLRLRGTILPSTRS